MISHFDPKCPYNHPERGLTCGPECIRNIQNTNNEVNTPTEKYRTKEEIVTLYNWLKNEFTPHENESLYQVINKITAIANDKLDSESR